MSVTAETKRVTVRDIQARKGGEPLVVLTAHSAPIARILDPHVDILLVGDSLGMVVYGMETTLGVTLDMMINHGLAVVRASRHAMVVVDMPFASYQESPQVAFRACARAMAEAGCQAVKLEGGAEMAETIAFLTQRGIPVMAHVGLKPQSIHAHGGFRAQGRDEAGARQIIADAIAVAEAGAFSLVVEGTVEPIARRVSEAVPIPTIGIGASPACDGQVLVTEDMLGLFTEFLPKHVRRYMDLATSIDEVAKDYAADVRARRFPAPENCFGAPKTGD